MQTKRLDMVVQWIDGEKQIVWPAGCRPGKLYWAACTMKPGLPAKHLFRLAARLFLSVIAWLSLVNGAAVAAEPIRIGVSLGLTGQYEQPSNMQLRAYEFWRDDVNGRGGLLGRPVELIIHDDGSDSVKAREIYRDFVSNGSVDHVFGPYSSEITAAVASEVDAAGFPMLAAGASADYIWRQGYENIFGMWTPASRYTQGMLRLARGQDCPLWPSFTPMIRSRWILQRARSSGRPISS